MSQLVLGEAPPPKSCSWCLVAIATTRVVGCPACGDCARETSKVRTERWLLAVGAGR